jgi:hypothetical protein
VGVLESPVIENPSDSDTGPVVPLLDTTVQNEQPASPQGPHAPHKPPPKSNEAILPACKLSIFFKYV